MQRAKFSPLLLPLLLAGACDSAGEGDDGRAPDRGALDEAVTFRPSGSGGFGGSTYLNTARVHHEGLPIHHFDRAGGLVTYDDPAATKVIFTRVQMWVNGVFTEFDPSLSTIEVVDGAVRIDGLTRTPESLLGSAWTFTVSDILNPPREVVLRMSGVATATVPGGAQVPLYNFTLDPAAAYHEGGPFSLCRPLDTITESSLSYFAPEQGPDGSWNAFQGRYAAVLYGGVKVNTLGDVDADLSSIYLGCVSGSIGKAALWGYPSWVSSYQGLSGLQQVEAVSRAIRADYCADGTSHTVDGTPIQIRDRFRAGFDDPSEATEAVWGASGTECAIAHDRLLSGATYTCGPATAGDCNSLGSEWIVGAPDFLWTKVGPDSTLTLDKTECDVAGTSAGCADPGIEAAVCVHDPYCCNIAWDSLCVSEVTTYSADDSACCADNGTPGCGNSTVSACVGGYDPYCTDTRWDSYCAQEVESLGCGLCR